MQEVREAPKKTPGLLYLFQNHHQKRLIPLYKKMSHQLPPE